MRGRICLLVAAACGRIGFDAERGAADGGPLGPAPYVVQTADNDSTSIVDIPFRRPTSADSVLVVATTSFGPGELVSSVVDDAGNQYAQVGQARWNDSQTYYAELWASANGIAGATEVSLTEPVMS
ncbi:MAG TPA: hypothetical protein VMJ10_27865, partial [Kofleriaceae bacterium]|nr:hypothetical protein [Kofleriaceae bacterium]